MPSIWGRSAQSIAEAQPLVTRPISAAAPCTAPELGSREHAIDAYASGVARRQTVARAALVSAGLRPASPYQGSLMLQQAPALAPAITLDAHESYLTIPGRLRQWAVPTLLLSAVAGSIDQAKTYALPGVISGSSLLMYGVIRGIEVVVEGSCKFCFDAWMWRTKQTVSCVATGLGAGAAMLADNPKASQKTGNLVDQWFDVERDYAQYLTGWPGELGKLLTNAYFISTCPEVFSPTLCGCIMGASLLGFYLSYNVRPALAEQLTTQHRKNRQQLNEHLPALAVGTRQDMLAWYDRLEINLRQLFQIRCKSILTNAGQRYTFIGATLAAYYLMGWLDNEVWTSSKRTDQIRVAVVATGQLASLVQSVAEQFAQWMENHRNMESLTVEIEGLLVQQGHDFETLLSTYIQWKRLEIFCDDEMVKSTTLLDIIDDGSHGYWTIAGESGTGKSTLLQMLKILCGEDAVLITAMPQVGLDGEAVSSVTVGDIMLGKLRHATLASVRVCLVDRWRLGVDGACAQEMGDLLDNLSSHKIVVEVVS